MDKHLCIILADAQSEIVSGIAAVSRKYGLPAYLLHGIIAEIYNQTTIERQNEVAAERKSLAANQKEETHGTGDI